VPRELRNAGNNGEECFLAVFYGRLQIIVLKEFGMALEGRLNKKAIGVY